MADKKFDFDFNKRLNLLDKLEADGVELKK